MATQAHTHSRRPRPQRARRIAVTVSGHWLLVLLSHTLATIIVMVVFGQVLHLPSCDGR